MRGPGQGVTSVGRTLGLELESREVSSGGALGPSSEEDKKASPTVQTVQHEALNPHWILTSGPPPTNLSKAQT